MNTNAKLYNLGIRENATCYLCGSDVEDLNRLFFNCNYSQKVIDLIGEWSTLNIPYTDTVRWRLSRNGSKEDKGILNAILNACLYHIWHQRNSSRVELCLLRPQSLLARINSEMKTRFMAIAKSFGNRQGRLLTSLIGDMNEDEDDS
ncbi:hypothetical protein RND81_14G159400 [Saponaria officinalis]|uniref:Reverse transcriptase zinc-binding domain-containing protein n=1 Tax=Saponaria officinalis TaxID=3572 RepID=A0AAW1GSU0_SAPOF